MQAGTDPALTPDTGPAEREPVRVPVPPAAAEPGPDPAAEAEPAPSPAPSPAAPAAPRWIPPPLSFAVSDRKIVAMLAVLSGALFAFAARLRLDAQPWGDEPHYLIMSI